MAVYNNVGRSDRFFDNRNKGAALKLIIEIIREFAISCCFWLFVILFLTFLT